MKDLISYLAENGMIPQSENDEIACLTLGIKGNEVVIKGNATGLIQLAEYMISTALKNFNGAHVHIDESNLFDEGSGELIIVKHSRELE